MSVEDQLFPFTDRFLQMIFADLKQATNIDKELTPKTLRHTHVVRPINRGEGFEQIFDRIGLVGCQISPWTFDFWGLAFQAYWAWPKV